MWNHEPRKRQAEPWLRLNFQEGEISTLSKWDKLYVVSALLSATSLMACSVSASEFLIFQPLLEVDYAGVRFLHVSSRFPLSRRHKIDGAFRFCRRAAQPSANGSMRYMMCIPCTSLFISRWDALCLADPGWYMSWGILLCVVIDVLFSYGFVSCMSPFYATLAGCSFSYVYCWDPLFSRIGGILLFITCQLWSYW